MITFPDEQYVARNVFCGALIKFIVRYEIDVGNDEKFDKM